jgi:hypothetical protein
MTYRMSHLVAAFAVMLMVATGAQAATQEEPFEPTMLEVSHLTCEEVWIGVAEQDDPFFQVVELFAYHILTRREIEFPESDKVAKAFGDALVKNCLADPDELLYSAVSRSLRDTLPVEN